jgi:hypothetical protein
MDEPKQCEAVTRKGIRCKNYPIKGYTFCHSHSLKRLLTFHWAKLPWYYNPLFLTIIGGLITWFCSWYYARGVATEAKQNEILRIQKLTGAKVEHIEAALDNMMVIEKNEGTTFKKEFIDYRLVTLDSQEFIPLLAPTNSGMKIHWENKNYSYTDERQG